jgi:hypothetical protein
MDRLTRYLGHASSNADILGLWPLLPKKEFHMHYTSLAELFVILLAILLKFGIPIAFAIWVMVAIKRLLDGIKRVSSRLDVVEKYLMDKGNSTGGS